MKRLLALLLCLWLLPCTAVAMEGAYLTGEVLNRLEPAYEEFLRELAEELVQQGLLQEAEREAWVMYQLGDYLQNGGFGSIMINYMPGLLGIADESVTMRRFAMEVEAGTVLLETLRHYSEVYSPLPGLPLDVRFLDRSGKAVEARYRWSAEGGAFRIWDEETQRVVDVGESYVVDTDAPLYWYEEPYDGLEEPLTLEILAGDEDTVLVTVMLALIAEDGAWTPEGFQ